MASGEPSDLYAIRPDLYDLMHAEQTDDMRFLDEFVRQLADEPRVLELGCGTGRLLIPLLDAGAHVVGIDREPEMLAVAHQRIAQAGDRGVVVRGDMRRFSVQGRFDLAIVGLNTFMHLLSQSEQLDCLESIHHHLRPAGLLLLDLANPHVVLRDTPMGVLQHRFTYSSREAAIQSTTLWSSTSVSTAEQIAQSTLFFEEVEATTGSLRRTVVEVTLRLIYRFELELLLQRAGFALLHLYGDYESSPYDDDSSRMICVASALA